MEESKIEQFILMVIESEEFLRISYLAFNIRRSILDYISRKKSAELDYFMKPLADYIINAFQQSGIDPDDMIKYLIDSDKNCWVLYFVQTKFKRKQNVSEMVYIQAVLSGEKITHYVEWDDKVFSIIILGYVLSYYNNWNYDLRKIVDSEKFAYETNAYGLTSVTGVEFKRDGLIYDDKYYLYNVFTNTSVIDFTAGLPAFARIFQEQVRGGDILLRLDERLAVAANEPICYSSLNFEKYRGSQFNFKNSIFENQKSIIVHYDKETMSKLLLVVKKRTDAIGNEFWNVEIETLPYVDPNKKHSDFTTTTFLHGMYYPERDIFTHIDYTKNQYNFDDYQVKYLDINPEIPIDFYADKKLHYKIWCIENGEYSREVWYNLMIASLPEQYQVLLNEMLV